MAISANAIIPRATQVVLIITAVAGILGSLRLGLWSRGSPGPGLFPLVASIMLLVCVGIRVILPTTEVEDEPVNWRRVSLYSVGIIALVVLFMTTGFVIGIVVGTFIIMHFAEEQKVLPSLVASLLITLACIALFDYFLRVPLPYGPLQPLKFWM